MDFDRSKHNVIKYLPTNNDENIWGMSISGIGFQSIDPKGSYPLKGHPIGYTFNPDRGRIIDEFALVYIVKGEGTFTSINCLEKKISKGDAFFIFPGQWHSYQPIANIGWDEYYVTFQGDYFEKLLNGIINRANPIFHIGMNDQIVKHFGEMLDCVRMRENIYDKFTPEDIAESINMSYSNFRKSFKQYTGIAPHQYMLQLKLSKIKDLLSSTEMSIQDIAMKLNFESADYFSYFFRSKTGINPLSYRKEIEKQREKAKKNSH